MKKLIIENAQNYCNNNIFKLGSDIYYSCLFLDKEKKDAISSIILFYKKISNIVNNNKDKDLNLIKLNWWKKEITNLFLDKPSHPISIALKIAIKKFNIEKKLLLNIIKGVYSNLNKKYYNSMSELNKFFYYSYSSVIFSILK